MITIDVSEGSATKVTYRGGSFTFETETEALEFTVRLMRGRNLRYQVRAS